jgi:hypothetical protein
MEWHFESPTFYSVSNLKNGLNFVCYISLSFITTDYYKTGKMEEFKLFFDSNFKFGVPPFSGLYQIGRNGRGSRHFLRKKFKNCFSKKAKNKSKMDAETK